jgi:hypothetical protein
MGIELHGTGYVLGKIFATGKVDKEKLLEKVGEMREGGWFVSAEDYLIDCSKACILAMAVNLW